MSHSMVREGPSRGARPPGQARRYAASRAFCRISSALMRPETSPYGAAYVQPSSPVVSGADDVLSDASNLELEGCKFCSAGASLKDRSPACQPPPIWSDPPSGVALQPLQVLNRAHGKALASSSIETPPPDRSGLPSPPRPSGPRTPTTAREAKTPRLQGREPHASHARLRQKPVLSAGAVSETLSPESTSRVHCRAHHR